MKKHVFALGLMAGTSFGMNHELYKLMHDKFPTWDPAPIIAFLNQKMAVTCSVYGSQSLPNIRDQRRAYSLSCNEEIEVPLGSHVDIMKVLKKVTMQATPMENDPKCIEHIILTMHTNDGQVHIANTHGTGTIPVTSVVDGMLVHYGTQPHIAIRVNQPGNKTMGNNPQSPLSVIITPHKIFPGMRK